MDKSVYTTVYGKDRTFQHLDSHCVWRGFLVVSKDGSFNHLPERSMPEHLPCKHGDRIRVFTRSITRLYAFLNWFLMRYIAISVSFRIRFWSTHKRPAFPSKIPIWESLYLEIESHIPIGFLNSGQDFNSGIQAMNDLYISELLKWRICESTESQSVSGYLPLAGVVRQVFTLLLERHFPRVHDDGQISCLDIGRVHLRDNIITITAGWYHSL